MAWRLRWSHQVFLRHSLVLTPVDTRTAVTTERGHDREEAIMLYACTTGGLWRSLNRCTFPVAVFGRSGTTYTQRGYL
jgi:hypothetical protein